MKAKRKILISMLAIVFVLFAVVATISVVFALTQQTITTTLDIGYIVQDIDGTASATYTIGGVTETLTAKKGDKIIGDKLIFKAGDTEDAGNLMFPEGELPLSAQNDNIVLQYTYTNSGDRHYIASMSFDSELKSQNMKVEYSIDGTNYSTSRYAVVVPANSTGKSYWIKISIDNKAKSASFVGDFKWLLEGTDELGTDEYISLTSLEFQQATDSEGNAIAGSYSASMSSAGGREGQVVFPSSINGDPVTTITASSLSAEDKAEVTSVYIPESVTKIDKSAFENFVNLETVTFEQNESVGGASAQNVSGLLTIGEKSFHKCSSLTSFEIPSSVTRIRNGAFLGCTGLTSIIIPDTVTTLSNDVFRDCTGLQSLKLGNGITKLYSGAFQNCTGLTSLTIPDNLISLNNAPFRGCSGLTSINVSSGNTKYRSVGNCLISIESKTLVLGCKTSEIPTDGSVTSIYSAFSGCTGLTSIIIPNTVTSISYSAFSDCTGLTSITIPESVTSIGSSAFSDCTGLTSITIPSNVKTIEQHAFFRCANLTSLIFENTTDWYYEGDYDSIHRYNLSNPTTAATYFVSVYSKYTWKCE